MINLSNERFLLTLDLRGATILGLRTQAGTPILQSLDLAGTKQDVVYTPDKTGGFPLLPIANRVKGNVYELEGQVVTLDKNSADGSEYLHGQGWQSLWQLKEHSSDHACLSLDFEHPSNGYVYSAELIFTLTLQGLEIEMSISHKGQEPRLYGLGFHPYFAVEPNIDKLYLNVTGYYPEIEGHFSGLCSQTISEEFDYRQLKPISDSFVNHCYVGFHGLQIHRESLKQDGLAGVVSMESTLSYLMMYHMPHSKFLALEPVSHEVDGCHKVGFGGLKILSQPFNTLQEHIKITVQ